MRRIVRTIGSELLVLTKRTDGSAMGSPREGSFNAHVGAAVLRKLADLADREPSHFVSSTHPVFATAACVLGDAKAWLEQYRTPFQDFAGDHLLTAFEYGRSLATDKFTSALTNAAFELATVARLVELRDVRKHPSYGIGSETTRGK